nr:alpha/beta fold hydrolase [Reinekea marinisedimentorum]
MLVDGDVGCPVLVLAHGAGAPMDSDFMNVVARGIADHGVRVVRFEFLYMQRQRASGRRQPPDRQPKLLDHFREVLSQLDVENPVIGGKSMGGRMATLLAAQQPVAATVVLGYPFHALGKPEKVRTDHFVEFDSPVLICQGERDAMGNRQEVARYRLPENVQIEWFEDGDHDLKPRKSSGLTHEQHLTRAIGLVSDFILSRSRNQLIGVS